MNNLQKLKSNHVPLSLYIHFPWCKKKCPYCDFNSYPMPCKIPEEKYCEQLILDLSQMPFYGNREIESVFLGGGTPSLFSARNISYLLEQINKQCKLATDAEITIEANPGTVNKNKLIDFKKSGINRLSIGIQSLEDEKLKSLGRIHNRKTAIETVGIAKKIGFSNINIDLMHGLPNQMIEEAICDLDDALKLDPTHLSWYQLMIEPNTPFAKTPLALPSEDQIWQIENLGKQFIADNGFAQYEISAYCKPNFECKHNLNYWLFGDYIGVGAGAHSKITYDDGTQIRYIKQNNPTEYLKSPSIEEQHIIKGGDLALEFMLNALRLNRPIAIKLFNERTGLSFDDISEELSQTKKQGFLSWDDENITTTNKGKNFLNDLLQIFLGGCQ